MVKMSSSNIIYFACLIFQLYISGLDGDCTLMKCSDPTSAPKPCGPYCTAIRVNNTVYLSGVIGIDKTTDKLADGGIKHETECIFAIIKNILKYYNSTYENIARVTVYMTDFEEYGAFNDLYQWYIRHPYPARTLVKVSELPEGAKLQLEVTAIISDEGRFETDD